MSGQEYAGGHVACGALPYAGKSAPWGRDKTGETPLTLRGKNMSDIADRVKKIVVEHLGVEADKVTETASFIDDLGADSLDTVELIMEFEKEFNIAIPDDQAEKIQTVGQAIDYVEKNAK